ncbi:MAG: thioredoxin domain-containing protein [Melioribacteraceae bacterium]|nr:thioredoxin domain-containing protein [Melioribacteraceae bacterium]
MNERKTNRLINEKSPYLLQHAYNPVDWYPWSDEAFEKAEKENKPIFLSIGYSTCHWCHVMEHESFEDPEVAKLMNEYFVSIKVDREERPDIDNIYMTVCQMMTGGGGWPLTIVMMPDKRPFFSGTYFPKQTRFGRIGFVELVQNINKAWKEKRDEVEQSADQITSHLKQTSMSDEGTDIPTDVLTKTYEYFFERFDKTYGGLTTAPKFPSPHNLLFLLRYYKNTGEENALEMVKKTLLEMRKGGIFDHIGFGFHRYSTDQRWLLPHFEKMLYDQAMLTHAYVETYQTTKIESFKKTAEQILEYVTRDMTSPEGGFYSAEDADSEGVEGKFYVWTKEEILKILGEEDGTLFCKVFNIEEDGNYEEESTKARNGTNIPHLTSSIEDIVKESNTDPTELINKLNKARLTLFANREQRVHPLKDDKILTDWNGLMISSFAKAGRVFDNEEYTETASKGVEFINEHLTDKDGKLIHRYRDGEAKLTAVLDDYAFMIWGLLELYESTFETKYLEQAISLNEILNKHYWDDADGGYFFTPDFGENLLVRSKDLFDSAIPSGASAMMNNLIRFSRLTSNQEYEKSAELLSKSFSENVKKSPMAFTYFLCGLDFAKGKTYEIILAGKSLKEFDPFMQKLNENYIPNKVVLAVTEDNIEEMKKIAPFISNYEFDFTKAQAFVCKNFACELPVDSPDEMMEKLNG